MTSQTAQKIERLMVIQCDNAFILYGPDLMLMNKKHFTLGQKIQSVVLLKYNMLHNNSSILAELWPYRKVLN